MSTVLSCCGHGTRRVSSALLLEVGGQPPFLVRVQPEASPAEDLLSTESHHHALGVQRLPRVAHVVADCGDDAAHVGIVSEHRGLHQRRIDDRPRHGQRRGLVRGALHADPHCVPDALPVADDVECQPREDLAAAPRNSSSLTFPLRPDDIRMAVSLVLWSLSMEMRLRLRSTHHASRGDHVMGGFRQVSAARIEEFDFFRSSTSAGPSLRGWGSYPVTAGECSSTSPGIMSIEGLSVCLHQTEQFIHNRLAAPI